MFKMNPAVQFYIFFYTGQMFINGKSCLGVALKNNLFHTWPTKVKEFLRQGSQVKMDVKKMSEAEQANVREYCTDNVMYTAPLVWRKGVPKPNESQLSISTGLRQASVAVKGTVTTIYPRWGVLSTPRGDVFFETHKFFVDNGYLPKSANLLKHLEKGDTLAAEASALPYLEMSEIAKGVEGFGNSRTTDNLKFHASTVWHLRAEIDPYAVKESKETGSESGDESTCDFLATSSTLFKPLPPAGEATMRHLSGTLEEVRLPDGGMVLLDVGQGLAPDQRYAYFHRSRLYVNGIKLASSTAIERELVPGVDRVTVDVVANSTNSRIVSANDSYTNTSAHWVALTVNLNTTERGVVIARNLKMEVEQTHLLVGLLLPIDEMTLLLWAITPPCVTMKREQMPSSATNCKHDLFDTLFSACRDSTMHPQTLELVGSCTSALRRMPKRAPP